jgi:hypothetical protein
MEIEKVSYKQRLENINQKNSVTQLKIAPSVSANKSFVGLAQKIYVANSVQPYRI